MMAGAGPTQAAWQTFARNLDPLVLGAMLVAGALAALLLHAIWRDIDALTVALLALVLPAIKDFTDGGVKTFLYHDQLYAWGHLALFLQWIPDSFAMYVTLIILRRRWERKRPPSRR